MTTATRDQAATVADLEALSTPTGGTVTAGPLPQVATKPCADDWAHGPGTCSTVGVDDLCPSCMARYVAGQMEPGAWLSVDVLRDPTAAAVDVD